MVFRQEVFAIPKEGMLFLKYEQPNGKIIFYRLLKKGQMQGPRYPEK
jgi:hypothetical protein